jgi:hypothetical protein
MFFGFIHRSGGVDLTEDKDQLGSSFGSRRRRLGNSPSPILLRILSAAENSNVCEPFRLRMLLYFYWGDRLGIQDAKQVRMGGKTRLYSLRRVGLPPT